MTGLSRHEPHDKNYETRDVPGRGAALFAISFVLTIAALVGLLSWWGESVWGFHSKSMADLIPWHTAEIPGPHLQVNPHQELEALHAEKEHRLNGLGWVDRAKGIVHIPIGDAMRIEAARAKTGGG